MFSTFDKIKELAKQQGISLNTLEEKLDFSTNYIYSIKKGNPKVENLQKIADYFHVSTDYLLGRTDNPNIATGETASKTLNVEGMAANAMMFGGRPLTDEKKKIIQSIIEGYLKEAGD